MMCSHVRHHERIKLELLWLGKATSNLGAHRFGEEALPTVSVLDGDQSKKYVPIKPLP